MTRRVVLGSRASPPVVVSTASSGCAMLRVAVVRRRRRGGCETRMFIYNSHVPLNALPTADAMGAA